MSETPETDAVWGDPYTGLTDCKDVSEGLEIDRNRWRSVAEQLEKFARFQKENGTVGPVGERLMNEGLSAFDSLRKEEEL
jgi:hypothetical protein